MIDEYLQEVISVISKIDRTQIEKMKVALDNIGWNGIESNKRDSKGNAIESKSMYSVLPKEITLGDKNALVDFIVLNNPTTDKVLHIQVNKPLELNLFTIDGKLLVKQYYQTGIQHINVNQYAHATYLLSSGRLTKKIIL